MHPDAVGPKLGSLASVFVKDFGEDPGGAVAELVRVGRLATSLRAESRRSRGSLDRSSDALRSAVAYAGRTVGADPARMAEVSSVLSSCADARGMLDRRIEETGRALDEAGRAVDAAARSLPAGDARLGLLDGWRGVGENAPDPPIRPDPRPSWISRFLPFRRTTR